MSDNLWSLIIVIALWGWVCSVIFFIFQTFTGREQFNVKAARFWGVFVVAFFGIWIAGLLHA